MLDASAVVVSLVDEPAREQSSAECRAAEPKPVTSPSAKSKPLSTQELTLLLVKVAEERDRPAFVNLFEHYAPRIKTYLMRQGASDSEAEDLAQEALLSVWRKADRFDRSKASAGTWIFTIARNLRIDALRRENRPQLDPNDPALVPSGEASPDSVLELSEDQAMVREALKTLPPEQSKVVHMSFFEEKPHGAIAEELGLPLGTVKSRLRLAMQRVRGAIGEME